MTPAKTLRANKCFLPGYKINTHKMVVSILISNIVMVSLINIGKVSSDAKITHGVYFFFHHRRTILS